MGLRTFTEFKSDVAKALGKSELIDGAANEADIGRYVNYGYDDLCSSVDFEVLDETATIPTVNGTVSVTAPADCLAIKVVRDVTADTTLGWLPKQEFYRRSAATGTATHWSRQEDLILLNPTPNGVRNLLVVYKKSPTPLATTAASVLPRVWDPVIFMLGVQYALLGYGDEQRAAAWHARAGLYISTRMTESDLQDMERGLGASFPLSMKQMLELQAGMAR